MDQSELDYYTYLKKDKEVLITPWKDIKEMVNEIPVDQDMIISSPRSINDEDWINPFVLTINHEAPQEVGPLVITNNHNMQLLHT